MAENNEPKLFSRTHPMTPEDEIVITGISGRFPSSKNMNELSHNLYNKVSPASPLEPCALCALTINEI